MLSRAYHIFDWWTLSRNGKTLALDQCLARAVPLILLDKDQMFFGRGCCETLATTVCLLARCSIMVQKMRICENGMLSRAGDIRYIYDGSLFDFVMRLTVLTLMKGLHEH